MSDQLSIFGKPEPDRQKMGRYHHDGTDTERISAALVVPRSGTQRSAVLQQFRSVGEHGSTDYEMWAALQPRCAYPHVAATRREELISDGWPIKDTGLRRRTGSGSPAIVWRLEE